MSAISVNIAAIHEKMAAACRRSGRNPKQVQLIAVSKIKPATMIEEAYAGGQNLFGENYVQEFCDKVDQVKTPVNWHFIGALQSNKVKYLAGKVAMIHSVDRLSLAREIDRQWHKLGLPIDILLQVNIGAEENKAGCHPQQLSDLVQAVAELDNLHVRGLMCLPPHHQDPELVRPYFRRMSQLAEQLKSLAIPGVSMDELSMGMSGDYEVAIEEGATLIRVGTAIFGARKKKD